METRRVMMALLALVGMVSACKGGKEKAEEKTLHLMYSSDGRSEPRIAEAIQAQWTEEIGVEVALDPKLAADKGTNFLEKHIFEIAIAGWGGDYLDPYTFLSLFRSGGGFNYPDWRNTAYDLLIDNGLTTVGNPTRAYAAYAQAEGLLLNDAVVIPLIQGKVSGLKKSYVTGIYPNPREEHPLRHVRINRAWQPTTGAVYYGTVTPPTDPAQVFRISVGSEFTTIEPQELTESWASAYSSAIFEGLANIDPKTGALDPNGQPLPGVAETWESSSDSLTWTFHLRSDAVWVKAVRNPDGTVARNADGSAKVTVVRPVKASDVVFSWKENCIAKTAQCPYREMIFDTIGFVDAQAVDDRTLVVTVNKPTGIFLQIMTFGTAMLVHPESVRAHGNKAFLPENVVTNGSYVLESVGTTEVRLVRNPKYWWWKTQPDAGSAPATIIGTLTKKCDTFQDTYRAGGGDWMAVGCQPNPEFVAQVERGEAKADDLYTTTAVRTFYLVINPKADPRLADRRFREALGAAIDMESIIKALNLLEASASALTPPGFGAYKPPQVRVYDPEKAKRLLAEAKADGYGVKTK